MFFMTEDSESGVDDIVLEIVTTYNHTPINILCTNSHTLIYIPKESIKTISVRYLRMNLGDDNYLSIFIS